MFLPPRQRNILRRWLRNPGPRPPGRMRTAG
ncbi:MAG: TilS substrate-binding domain-containing protein [Deltaproteobacteria bacterium]|nr:TilS substrate-binding domain-containing protein [Deltaproteobacteria bacterium]MBW1794446.1 TilS substrate-binding domain-containing protein [Deltaproteobacteria bacterium]MBW2329746.1 TilS substrate-binding domain-containing protein [Deltaproteobacteria bacterium]